jgi:hypothetical protein
LADKLESTALRRIAMGGPIVRTGTTPEFWKNWDNVFGEKGKKKASGNSAGKAPKASQKVAKKKSGKKKSSKK